MRVRTQFERGDCLRMRIQFEKGNSLRMRRQLYEDYSNMRIVAFLYMESLE